MDDTNMEIQGDQEPENLDPDKTGEINEEGKNEGESDKPKYDRSETAQKAKYREKYLKAKEELEKVRKANEKPSEDIDEKEKAARDYIKKQAREAYQEILAEKETEERRVIEEFDEKMDSLLEENPDLTKAGVLEIIEEFKVEPEVAISILNKYREGGKSKPKMPSPRRGLSTTPKENPDDSGKSMWQIAQEVIKSQK